MEGRAGPVATQGGKGDGGRCCLHPLAGLCRCRKSFIFHSSETGRLTVNLTKDRNYEALWSNDFLRLEEKDMGTTAPK